MLAFITHSIPPRFLEIWVNEVARLSGQKVDWHFGPGGANIFFVGDEAAVVAALRKLKPKHDALFNDAVKGHYRVPEFNWPK